MQQFTSGFRINFTGNIDLTNATSANLTIRRPDNAIIIYPIVFPTDIIAAKLGEVAYPIQSNDFSQVGWYSWQLGNTTSGQQQYSAVDYFYVRPNV